VSTGEWLDVGETLFRLDPIIFLPALESFLAFQGAMSSVVIAVVFDAIEFSSGIL
jgi:hypothetical protein